MPKVSVIVPIYNVEKYIERCVVSLFEQTLDDLEYVFVNDCTPDRSIEILHEVLNRYPQRKPQVKIINQDQNCGIGAARNTGLKNATSDYIIHCDSDDWVELNMYENLYEIAINHNADIVGCDLISEYNDKSIIHQHKKGQNQALITQEFGPCGWSLCGRIVKNSLLQTNNIKFIPDLSHSEDVCYLTQVYFYATRIFYLHKPLYHYNRENISSITHTMSRTDSLIQYAKTLKYLETWLTDNNSDSNKYQKDKIKCKDAFIWEGFSPNFKLWRQTFPELVPIITNNPENNYLYRKLYKLATYRFCSFPLRIWIGFSKLKFQAKACYNKPKQ